MSRSQRTTTSPFFTGGAPEHNGYHDDGHAKRWIAEDVDRLQRGGPALLCLSHLRWDFVFQRPQHLMTRFARDRRVFFIEEPIETEGEANLDLRQTEQGVCVVVPRLPKGIDPAASEAAQRALLDRLCLEQGVRDPLLWYYTPMALAFSDHLRSSVIVYDCMDELSAFRFAPPALIERERQLLACADLVFTGGFSLYEAKRDRHPRVHPFPSSVDVAHFGSGAGAAEPDDLAAIPKPRLGFCGVIDERMDLELLAAVADARPEWQLVMVGPIVKIAQADLPRRANIHYLGGRAYTDLPRYFAHWDAALMPFARNESTRFISPTKTPEYLAAGLPVVSTPITDVVRHYGALDGVKIAADAAEFVAGIEAALELARGGDSWKRPVDALLAETSWQRTWERMAGLIREVQAARVAPEEQNAIPIELARSPLRQAARQRRYQRSGFDYLIVGAGFAGSVLAERLAVGSGKRVLLVDRRPHIGGNAYDCYDDAGILIHRYGPHIFHTNAPHVAEYLSRFTQWRPYEHRVLASTGGLLVPIPINRTTINRVCDLDLLDEADVERHLASLAEPVAEVRTSEDVVVSKVGRAFYERFFRGYTRKMWDLDPSDLDKAVTARVPTRTNDDDRYFTDSFQRMPLHGYTRMFENMLDHPNIKIMVNTDYREIRDEIAYDHLIYTGPIDEFFDHRFGELPYRSLAFKHETHDQEAFQPVAVVNYPAEDVPYTRITEYKRLTGQFHPKTSVSYEFPRAEGDPYYPVPKPENAALFKRYQALADRTTDVTFVGRLATYRYYNMDQVVAQALTTYGKLVTANEGVRPAIAEVAQAVG